MIQSDAMNQILPKNCGLPGSLSSTGADGQCSSLRLALRY
jgi:hypothetical protein